MSPQKTSLTTRKLIIILSSVFVVLAAATITLILIFPTSDNSQGKKSSTANLEDVKYRVSPTDKFAPASYTKNREDYNQELANIKDPEVFQKIKGKLIEKCGKNYSPYIANAGLGDTISGHCYIEASNAYDSYIYFAYRLSDGEEVQFADLFINLAKVYPFLTPSICFAQIGADMWEDVDNSWDYSSGLSKRSCDEDILNRTIAEFTVDGIQPGQFYYSQDSISIKTVNAGIINLNMQDMMDNIAIYKRFKSGSLDQNAYAIEPMDAPQRFVFSTDFTSANYISDFIDSTAKIYVMADIAMISYISPDITDSMEVNFAKRQIDQYIKDKKEQIEKRQDSGKTYLLVVGSESDYVGNSDDIQVYIDGFAAEFSGSDALAQIAATTYTYSMGGAYDFASWIKDDLNEKAVIIQDDYHIKYNKTTQKDIKACKDISGIDSSYIVFPGEEVTVYDWSSGYRQDTIYSVDANCHATKLY